MNKKYYYLLLPCLLLLFYVPVRHVLADGQTKTVYITFDDCPTGYTEEILNTLKEHNALATFFILKVYSDERPELVEKIIAEGHGIGLHGVGHKKEQFYQTEFSPLWEMDEVRVSLFQLTGQEFYLARTPFGSMPCLSRNQYKRLQSGGYILWDWNVDTADAIGASVSTEKIIRRTVTGIVREETPVILMHNMRASATALPAILDFIDRQGYKTGLLSDCPKKPICFIDP